MDRFGRKYSAPSNGRNVREQALAKGRKKEKLFSRLFGIVFMLIGFFLFAISIYIGIENRVYKQEAVPVEATILAMRGADSESLGTPVIAYTIDGNEYTATLNTATSSMHPGKAITVYYREGSPHEVRYIDENGWVMAVLFFIGVVFAAIGTVFLVVKRRREQKMQRLLATGSRIETEVTDIRSDMSQNLNGKHPIIVSCRYTAPDGRIYLFQSGPFWYESYEIDPKKKVQVYIDRHNPSHYYVDVDSVVG